ncbi:TetR/AcrR family transcriptional regulator [Deinococcus alpinitundrae]|uniref:TetR/AcrR family transcriptional regulator n=1 Tax=Deinococcus alpinitundrae TaxID=468913 RepID=UPI00137B3558|nr:TetR/AcrR family transcriptional regulator [Deinococcus alpinitundrae]
MHVEEQLHPQTRRHLANTERLRGSAIKEFALHGLAGAKVSNIVANAQLTQPSFYRLWPSKEAAYQEIIDHTIKAWHTAAVLVFDDDVTWTSENLLARMEGGTLKLYEALTINLDLTTLVIRHQLHDPEQRETYVTIYDQGFGKLQRKGVIGQALTSEILAQTYLALTERFFYARLFNGQNSPLAAAREVAFLMISVLNNAGENSTDQAKKKPAQFSKNSTLPLTLPKEI